MAIFNGTSIDDTFIGNDEDDIINGNGGNDTLKGGGGNDTIDGGDGDDVIQGGLGFDTLNGGNGIDRVDYTTFNGDGIYNLVAGTANLGVFTEQILNFESIIAGNGNDTITLPSFGDDVLNLGFPAKTFAGGGNDLVNGGDIDDYIYGDAGNDTLNGNAGDDYLYGDAGDDIINGGDGDDYIQGGLGQDTLNGGAGFDQVDYTTFNGDAIYNLAAGSANLLGAFMETMLNFESIYAGGGNDTITGTSGSNRLYGGAGNDTINGGDGDDYIQGGLGQDTLNGGAGFDQVDYATFNGDAIYNLATGSANLLGAFMETMLNFEGIYAGDGNDTITGTSGINLLFGGAGNDTIFGDAGDDTIFGGSGNDYIQGGLGEDSLYGGDGTDTVDYTTFNGGGTYNLTTGKAILPGAFTETMSNFENINTGAGSDRIDGSNLGNRIFAGAGDDVIYALDGDDYVQGGLGNDTLDGGNGNDTVDYTTFNGDGTYDLTAGTANLGVSVFTETMLSFENIYTGAGNDRIFGTTGDNSLSGGAGDDDLFGLQGNDTLSGNAGDDDLFGGTGIDRFLFGSGVLSATNTVAGSIGKDKINDFTKGTDKIVLRGNAFNLTQAAFSANLLDLSFKSVANDALAETSTAAIVYSEGSQSLSYNPNGTAAGFGYGGTFATVGGMAPGTSLDTSNFVISTFAVGVFVL